MSTQAPILPSKNAALILSLSAGMVALAWFGDDWARALQFESSSIETGEYYRLITGHFVHLGWVHALLNAVALVTMSWVFSESFTVRTWLVTVVFCCAFTSWGLLTLTEVNWYRGFSGVLHGLFVVGALASGPILLWRLPLILGLICKLVFDLYWGDDGSTSALIGGEVVGTAHWLGALAGAVMGTLVCGVGARYDKAKLKAIPAPHATYNSCNSIQN